MNNNESKNKIYKKKKKDKSNEIDFQTYHMKDKIKKVKKKSKVKENYKNIEEFTTLNNINEPNENENEKINNIDNNSEMKEKTILEKILDIFPTSFKEGFDRDDYEGYDTVDNKEVLGDDVNIREMMIRSINNGYKSINKFNDLITRTIVDSLSTGEPKPQDYYLVQESISWIMSALISSYMVYNWYFLMFYSKDRDYDIVEISRMKMLENSSTDNHPEFQILLFLFEFSIIFVEKIDYFLIHVIPSITDKVFNGRMKFSLLYFGLIYITKKSLKGLKDFLINIIKAENGFIINIMYAIVALSFVISLLSVNITGVTKVDVGTIMSSISSIVNPLGTIIKTFFRLFFVMATNVPFAGIFVTIYLFVYSMFSTLIYGNSHKKGFDIFEEIDKHVMNSKSEYEINKECSDYNNIFYEIIRIINIFIDICYNKLLPIVLLIILIVSSISFNSGLSDINSIIPEFSFKSLTIIVFTMIIGILVPYIYSSSSSRIMKAINPEYQEKI